MSKRKEKTVICGKEEVHPIDWSSTSLGEICRKVKRGASPRPIGDDKWFDGDVGWVRIRDVTSENKYLNDTEEYLSSKGVQKSVQIYPGEVLMSIAGTVGALSISKMDACIHDGIVCFKDTHKDVVTEFLYYYLQRFNRHIESVGMTGTQTNLNSSVVGDIEFIKPPVPEQERIASVLYSVDEHVRTLDDRHDTLTDHKQALMQELFSGSVRFSKESHPNKPWTESNTRSVDETLINGIPEDWSRARLQSISEGSLYGLNESALSRGGEDCVEYIRVTNLKSYTSGLDKQMKYVKQSQVGDKKLGKNDILFARSGSVGKTCLTTDYTDMTYGGYMIRYRIDADRVNPKYLLQFTKSPSYWKWINRVARGGVQKNISAKEYDDLLIPLPTKDEQNEIASTLYTVDEMIARTVWLRDEYERLKQGLMQDLLSGDVRTPTSLDTLDKVRKSSEGGESA